ncbi:hypothetical protein TWF106_003245 [Orbilia oligospora]|uniref:Rhodopsin domain-containing protein n=1 Tax=Orbilia oligospora TaxID=2813651 RepID=A0A7C8UXB4_ORBOL|nr:hypothetical protein TWF106_003245 [Orbilia oligospora]
MSGFVASGEAVKSALSASTWIGAATPKYSHLVLSRVFDIYAEYIYANGFKLTRENLIEDFGTRPEDVDPFMKIFGGPNGIATYLTALPGLVPILPHPRNIPIIVPLFCVFTVMTSLAVGLRLWSRQKVAGGIRSFDWLALAGFGLTIIYGAVSVYHSKVSTLNYVQWAVYATGSVTIANSIAAIFTHCLAFRPIDYWNHFLQSPFKFNSRTPMLVFGAVYILTDVAIWIIPMPMVFQLKLYPREKVIAVITFSLGAVACVASGFRIWAIDEFQNYSDKNSSGLMIDAWTMIELNLTLICASAPAIRALAIHYAPKILSTLPSAFTSSGATRGSKSAGSSGKSKTPESEKSMQVSQSPVIPKEVV